MRYFRSLKEGSVLLPGAIFEYESNTDKYCAYENHFNNKDKFKFESSGKLQTSPQSVEEQPDWYEEIFLFNGKFINEKQLKKLNKFLETI